MLEERDEHPRDVVLLTHPLSLLDDDLSAAARRLRPADRLFAISVEESGSVELTELRHGTPVIHSRSRVKVAGCCKEVGDSSVGDQAVEHWKGDIEPIGFPFRLGALQPISDNLFDFDDSGEWLLLAECERGLLHVWSTDGLSPPWMLPRACVEDQVLRSIEVVLGVAGGFLIVGWIGKRETFAAAHYDFRSRICTTHPLSRSLIPDHRTSNLQWAYHRFSNMVLISRSGASRFIAAIDLNTDRNQAVHDLRGFHWLDAPAQIKEAVSAGLQSRKGLDQAPVDPIPGDFQGVRLDPISGEIEDTAEPDNTRRFTFLDDGHPALAGGRLILARRANRTLCLLTESRAGRRTLRLVRAPEFQPITSRQTEPDLSGFALSRDGRRFARRVGRREIEVAEVVGPWSQFTTVRGRIHRHVSIALGPGALRIHAGSYTHTMDWTGDSLIIKSVLNIISVASEQIWTQNTSGSESRMSPVLPLSLNALNDPDRFKAQCDCQGLLALLDDLGQVVVLDSRRRLIAMFLAYGDQVSGWMPDGSRFGPADRIGGSQTADALSRFATRLQEVQSLDPRRLAAREVSIP